jgi:putative ABC transport system ATP-binding protein
MEQITRLTLTPGMPLIEATDIWKIYDQDGTQTPALRGVSLTIAAGEFVAIMGPSGSGKSTLLHILGFLDTPTRGSYRFQDQAAKTYRPAAAARVRNRNLGFVFQTFNLLARTTVRENVLLPLTYSTVPEAQWEQRAREAIAAVGLSHRVDHTPAQLSGGERQRVAIARALVNRPAVILADEPTGNLDSKSGANILTILQELHRGGGHTIVVITHDQTIAEHAQRAVTIHDGCIIRDLPIAAPRRAAVV